MLSETVIITTLPELSQQSRAGESVGRADAKNGKANTRIRPPPKRSPSKLCPLNIEKKENKGILKSENKNAIYNYFLSCAFDPFARHTAKRHGKLSKESITRFMDKILNLVQNTAKRRGKLSKESFTDKTLNLVSKKIGDHLLNETFGIWRPIFFLVIKNIKNWRTGEGDWGETVKDIFIFIMDVHCGKWRLFLLLLKDRSEITEDDMADILSEIIVWLVCCGLAI